MRFRIMMLILSLDQSAWLIFLEETVALGAAPKNGIQLVNDRDDASSKRAYNGAGRTDFSPKKFGYTNFACREK